MSSLVFFVALIPPAIFAGVNYIDKYLVSRYFRGGGVGALMIFSSLIGAFVAVIIALFQPHILNVPFSEGLILILNGGIYMCAVLPYLHAVQENDISVIVPLFQLTPVFSFFLEWALLGSTLQYYQLASGVVIIGSAIFISIDMGSDHHFHLKKKAFLLMSISSLLFAANSLLFKYFAISTPFWTTSFYEYIGFACVALILFLFVRRYRAEFLRVVHDNKREILMLNVGNEVLNITGKITFNAVSLLMPVTLAWILGGFQPVFTFVYGILLTLALPRFIKENIEKRVLIQKTIAIAAMLGATFLLGR